jgi:hypothetical protein
MDDHKLARQIGLLSLGVGLGMLAAPGQTARLLGMGEHRQIVRYLGVRDFVIGAGLVSKRAPRRWVQARMVADIGDAAMLATGMVTGAFDPRKAVLGIGVATGFSGLGYWLAGRLR